MEYQDIITEYKNRTLDTSDINEKLEVAKALKQRPELRAIEMSDKQYNMLCDHIGILDINEDKSNFEYFDKECKEFLKESFSNLVESIKSYKAWKVMDLIPKEYTLEKFEQLDRVSQFDMIFFLNKKYQQFLEYQNIADIKLVLEKYDSKVEDQSYKIAFLEKMFNSFSNDFIKSDFFAFYKSKKFLTTIMNYKKSKNKKQTLHEYISDIKNSEIQKDYKKASVYFSTEDFRDIAENLILTKQTLKISKNSVIDIFREMSESQREKELVEDEYTNLRELEKKYMKFVSLIKTSTMKSSTSKNSIAKSSVKKETKAREKVYLTNNENKENVHQEDNKTNITEKIKEETRINEEHEEINNDIIENPPLVEINYNDNGPKEKVRAIRLIWFGRKDVSLGRTVGVENINNYLKDIHEEELRTGVRTSLFLVTNADREVTAKRIVELKKRAKQNGMDNLVEGALGGYGSFFVDKNEHISNAVIMSSENREKIMKTMDSSFIRPGLMTKLVDNTENEYLRYVFSDKEDKSITIEYLRTMKKKLLSNPKLADKPLVLLIYKEGHNSGIDVILKSQFLEETKILDYYKSRYIVDSVEKITPQYLVGYRYHQPGADGQER